MKSRLFLQALALVALLGVAKSITFLPWLRKGAHDATVMKLKQFLSTRNLAPIIRLAFHDCVGGCDGCINIAHPENGGLEPVIKDLETFYQANKLNTIMTRADFWALASQHAVKRAVLNSCAGHTNCTAPSTGIFFKFGRDDCATSPFNNELTGVPNTILQDSRPFFAKEFGFSTRDTVAILGSHNLGEARTQNSGVNGTWVRGQTNILTNKYYKVLLDSKWIQVANTPEDEDNPHLQWDTPDGSAFMLNSDIGIWKDIKINPDTGEAGCEIDKECKLVPGAFNFVVQFSKNNALFIKAFGAAFMKMQTNGNFTLRLVTP